MRMKILYEMINAKAGNTFRETITLENFNSFIIHWIGVARQLQHEFREEGLIETANRLESIIKIQQKILK